MKHDPFYMHQEGLDQFEFRSLIVNFLDECIANGHISWDEQTRGSTKLWIEKFSQPYVFPEQEFIQIASVFLNRKIVLYPVDPYNANPRKIEISPHENCGCGLEAPDEAFTMLYYEETNFVSPHYQSIFPIHR